MGGQVVIIDVSQSVENEHPQALDCLNVNGFFKKNIGRNTVQVKQFFDFVVNRTLPIVGDKSFAPGQEEDAFVALLEAAELEVIDEFEEEVFVKTWIPSTLEQIGDRAALEREVDKRDRGEELLYGRLIADEGKEGDLEDGDEIEEANGPRKAANKNGDKEASPDEGEDDEEDEEDDDDEDGDEGKGDGHKPEGMSKAEWKAKVKEEKRQKREDKVPKATKKKFR